MGEFSIFRWLVVLAIVLLLVFGQRSFPRSGDPRGGPPTHPIPATGPIETSRSPKNPEEPPKPGLRASKH